MSAFSNWLEDAILTYFFRPAEAAPTRPTAVYVALSSTAPAEDGTNVTEPTFTGYERQEVTFGAPSDGTGTSRKISNSVAIEFGDPDEDGSVSHFAIFDAATGGNMLAYGPLGAVVNYQASVSDPLSFPIGSLTISQD